MPQKEIVYASHIPQVSQEKQIREMGSQQLVSYLEDAWNNIYQKNTGAFLLNYQRVIVLCNTTYKQLTGNPIIVNINEEITKFYTEHYPPTETKS